LFKEVKNMNVEKNIEDMLGLWAQDPRSVEGARALSQVKTEVNNQADVWASKDLFKSEFDDPRVVATRAAIRDAKLPDRLFQPGNYRGSAEMRPGMEYSVTGR
jgi:hypothetical protein